MKKEPQYVEGDLPQPGSVFFVPLDNGMFSIARVVRRETAAGPESTPARQVMAARVLVVPSAWVGASAVRPSDEQIREPLILNHHSWSTSPERHLSGSWIYQPVPADFRPAGSITLTEEEAKQQSRSHGNWGYLCVHPLLQWRWDHDREALLRDEAAEVVRKREEWLRQKARQDEIRKTLTLDILAERTWFEKWDTAHEATLRQAAQQLILDMIEALRAQPKLTKPTVRRHLRLCVQAFNKLDGPVHSIQTTHAEDIDEALDLIVSVAGHPTLADSIDEWRDW